MLRPMLDGKPFWRLQSERMSGMMDQSVCILMNAMQFLMATFWLVESGFSAATSAPSGPINNRTIHLFYILLRINSTCCFYILWRAGWHSYSIWRIAPTCMRLRFAKAAKALKQSILCTLKRFLPSQTIIVVLTNFLASPILRMLACGAC